MTLNDRREITIAQFQAELHAQGVSSHKHFAFRCVVCGTIQSAQDLINAGAGKNFDEVERFVGYSCIGRWTNAGPHKNGVPSGHGCDWTLGGLFSIHKLVVIDADGNKHPRFELASPQDAQLHQKLHEEQESK